MMLMYITFVHPNNDPSAGAFVFKRSGHFDDELGAQRRMSSAKYLPRHYLAAAQKSEAVHMSQSLPKQLRRDVEYLRRVGP